MSLAGTGKNDDPDAIVLINVLEGQVEIAQQLRIQRIRRRWSVHSQDLDGIKTFTQEDRVPF